MRYNVGRACAAAGYKALYDELDLLPDVSIAEEARDNGHMDIFDAIVNQAVRYAVMNDYTRTVELENPRADACLNGDTAVRSSLERPIPKKKFKVTRTDDHYFDIQEDKNARPSSWPTPECSTLEARFTELTYMPLPRDLPALNKDILILLAAWDGNVERYSRLRRPVLVPNELTAVLRGVYHHSPFARWLATCVDDIVRPETSYSDEVTLACIASSYQPLYNELTADTEPTQQQLEMAVQVMNPHYREDVLRRADEHGVKLFPYTGSHDWEHTPWPHPTRWSRSYLRPDKEIWKDEYTPRMPKELFNRPDEHDHDWDEWCWLAGDPLSLVMNEQMDEWMCFISATDNVRREAAKQASGPRNPWYLYSSEEDKTRRQTPVPEPSRPKNFDDEGYFP
ncbi:hypothetical protein CCHR01_10137 [Colletotrichum chrysophilum]|uniref:Uncharacterized protein n=1 Tax=Colletotrichum chrysophilum TaxID=1836956 RepID=A0AAD9AH23_9PEZI|nr:hypothetical protein CCHR01_10137 [Colletotrichum chrysophilum]